MHRSTSCFLALSLVLGSSLAPWASAHASFARSGVATQGAASHSLLSFRRAPESSTTRPSAQLPISGEPSPPGATVSSSTAGESQREQPAAQPSPPDPQQQAGPAAEQPVAVSQPELGEPAPAQVPIQARAQTPGPEVADSGAGEATATAPASVTNTPPDRDASFGKRWYAWVALALVAGAGAAVTVISVKASKDARPDALDRAASLGTGRSAGAWAWRF